MRICAEMERWGEKDRLTAETMKRLREEWLTSLEDFALVTPERIKANEDMLHTEQSFLFENAVQNLRLESTHHQVVDESQGLVIYRVRVRVCVFG